MKKILLALILFSLVLPVTAAAVIAQPESCTLVEKMTDIHPNCEKNFIASIETYGACCAVNSIFKVTNFVFTILVGIAIFLFLIGAFVLITAAGNPEKVTSGRNYILYAIIGLAVAMLAKAVPTIAKLVIGA